MLQAEIGSITCQAYLFYYFLTIVLPSPHIWITKLILLPLTKKLVKASDELVRYIIFQETMKVCSYQVKENQATIWEKSAKYLLWIRQKMKKRNIFFNYWARVERNDGLGLLDRLSAMVSATINSHVAPKPLTQGYDVEIPKGLRSCVASKEIPVILQLWCRDL